MTLPPDRPYRRDMRLPGWDYRRPGPYAITICAEHRIHRFGHITDGRMVLNEAGHMVVEGWLRMESVFPTVIFDTWVVMPNHLHAIVRLAPGDQSRNAPLGTIVQRFKSLTTARYADRVHTGEWEPFAGRLWQRNFYDHIIRDAEDLDRCRRYIVANPVNWLTDVDREPELPAVGSNPAKPASTATPRTG